MLLLLAAAGVGCGHGYDRDIELVRYAALHHVSAMKIPGLPTALRTNLADLSRIRRGLTPLLQQLDPSRLTPAASPGTRLEEVAGVSPNPGALRMLRFVPPGLPAGAPLVVVLHGCTQTAAGYDQGTGWSALAERHGFALLLPEQTPGQQREHLLQLVRSR